MNSRERVKKALDHKQPDKLPVDFGGWLATGINVSTIYKIRQRLGLDKPKTPVKIVEPYQLLGEIDEDLRKVIGVDVYPILGSKNFFGFENTNWKEWELWDGTPVLVPEKFNTEAEDDGRVYMYAKGDKNYPPCAVLPKKGYYFDEIIRQEKIDDNNLNVKDNLEEFKIISDDELNYIKEEVDKAYYGTDYFLFGSLVSSGFGDIALVPAPTLKDPKGIRDIAEWYISIGSRKEYVRKIFEGQCDIAIENYKKIFEIVGNKIGAFVITGTDFGTQTSLFFSVDTYRELFKPFHSKVNKWIHENTEWKTFIHTDGAIEPLMSEFIEAEFDILNPVQISCKNMEPASLKKKYGKHLTFWGAGIDTQYTLPFGTPKEVKEQVRRLIEIFNKDGGFVFSSIHNVQASIPTDNMLAMFEVIREYR
jgi:hypothetical protein